MAGLLDDYSWTVDSNLVLFLVVLIFGADKLSMVGRDELCFVRAWFWWGKERYWATPCHDSILYLGVDTVRYDFEFK
jgi:hypothetical protein